MGITGIARPWIVAVCVSVGIALLGVELQQGISAQSANNSPNGRYVIATQTDEGIGGRTGVLWVVDSQSGALRAFTLVVAQGGAIQYSEIPRVPQQAGR